MSQPRNPLQKAKSLPNKRQHPRYETDLHIDIVFTTDPYFSFVVRGRAYDISRIGLRLDLHKELPVSSHVNLVVHYCDYESSCIGEVMWTKPLESGTSHGIRILRWLSIDAMLSYKIGQPSSVVKMEEALVI